MLGHNFLKGGADTFPISFFQGLSFLHLEITLPFTTLCYAFEEKLFFFYHNSFSCLKLNLKMCHKSR